MSTLKIYWIKITFVIGVAVLDGSLCVTGWEFNGTVEIYNPITKTWTMDILSKHVIYYGVVVNRLSHQK